MENIVQTGTPSSMGRGAETARRGQGRVKKYLCKCQEGSRMALRCLVIPSTETANTEGGEGMGLGT